MRDLGGWVSKQVGALLQLRGDKLAGQSMSEQKAKNQLKGATLWELVPSLVEICHCTKHAEEHCKIPNSVKIKTESELSNQSVLFGCKWISYLFILLLCPQQCYLDNHLEVGLLLGSMCVTSGCKNEIWIKQVKLILIFFFFNPWLNWTFSYFAWVEPARCSFKFG